MSEEKKLRRGWAKIISTNTGRSVGGILWQFKEENVTIDVELEYEKLVKKERETLQEIENLKKGTVESNKG